MSNYPRTLNVETVRRTTQCSIDRNRAATNVARIFLEVLQKFNGKKITKRLTTAVQAALEAKLSTHYTVYLRSFVDSYMTLDIYDGTVITYTERLSFFIAYIGYDSRYSHEQPYTEEFNFEVYKKHQGDQESNYQELVYKAEYGLMNVDRLVNDYNDAVNNLESARNALTNSGIYF